MTPPRRPSKRATSAVKQAFNVSQEAQTSDYIDPFTDSAAVAERLRRVIEQSNVSLQSLATHCQVSRPAVSGWLKHGKVARRHIATIAKVCNTTPMYLLTGENGAHSAHSPDADGLARAYDALPNDEKHEIYPALVRLLKPKHRR